MEEKIIVAGFGGQGVLSLGMLISYAAIHDGKGVTWLPSYGPEMRGGTSNCSVVVADGEVASPIIAVPDYLVAMNKPSLAKFVDRVKVGGTVIVNSSLIDTKVERTDVKVVYVNANELGIEAGNAKCANIVVLGLYTKLSGAFSKDTMQEVIKAQFANKPKVIPSNLKAFDLGFDLVK